MNGRKFLLVYNNKAGKGSFLKKLIFIKKLFLENDIDFDSINITDVNEKVFEVRYDTVVAIGGDGTVMAILPYIVNNNIKLGIIPCGTANLLAKKLNIPSNIPQAVDILINGTQKLIDVGKINESYFILRVGYGIDADIISGASYFLKQKLGYIAYLIQGIKCAFNLSPKKFEICTDEKSYTVNASAVIVSNAGNMFGNGFSVAPGSDLSDGMLDVFVLHAKNIIEFLAVIFQILFNKHRANSNVLYEKTNHITINSQGSNLHIDGELCIPKIADISLMHNALAVLAP